MNFGMKLQTLRKEKGLSQEDLAQELNVSRQAVSKWENNDAYPELDKIILVSQMFNVSLDYLIKDEGSTPKNDDQHFINHDVLEEYKNFQKHYRFKIALAVSMIILSAIFPVVNQTDIGVVMMFIIVAMGVTILIVNGLSHEKYDRLERKNIQMSFQDQDDLKKEYVHFKKRFDYAIALGVGMIILAFAAIILLDDVLGINHSYSPAILFCFVSIAVFIFISFGMKKSMYHFLLFNDQYMEEKNAEKTSVGRYIMPLAAMIYLVLGFVWNAWHPGWIIFPVAAILVEMIDHKK